MALGAFHTTIFITSLLSYRFQQAQPLAISNVATRNINSPVGKMAAMRMPAPMAMANIPMMQFRPPRNTRLRLLSLQPNI